MRVALLRPGPSALGQHVTALAEGWPSEHELELFGPEDRPLAEFDPQEHERLLVPIANEAQCVSFLPILRELGGTVWLQDWDLPALARAYRPRIATGGLRGRLAAWREGGLAAWRGKPSAMNRSVVRCADAFLVASESLREQILLERNAPTPVGILYRSDPAEIAERLFALPGHRSNRKSLIQTAIDASDDARKARRAGTD